MLKKDILTKQGLRTLSDKMGNYDPMSYHNGSIWPFDNWFFVEALDKYNYKNEAGKIRKSILSSLEILGSPYECFTMIDGNLGLKLHTLDGQDLYPEKIQAWTVGTMFSFLKKS